MIALSKFSALLALIIGISACGGGNPAGPQKLCTDQSAANFGGPLPCVPKPAPVATSVAFRSMNPASGSVVMATVTQNPNGTWSGTGGQPVNLQVSYTVGDADVAQAGEEMRIMACMSDVDGPTPARPRPPYCISRVQGDRQSTVDFSFTFSPLDKMTEVRYVIMVLYKVPAGALHNSYDYGFSGGIVRATQPVHLILKPGP